MKSPFDPDQLRGNWEVFEVTETMRRSRLRMGEDKYGNAEWIVRTEHIEDEALFEMNQAQRDANEGRSWGDGKVVARIPLNKFYEKGGLSDHIKIGDKDHIKWWLNKEEHGAFRTKKGVI